MAYCNDCGNKRFFYLEVSVTAKQIIDTTGGARNGKIYDVDYAGLDNIFNDGNYICKKCESKDVEHEDGEGDYRIYEKEGAEE
ncbi:hypothetical protein SJY89_20185 [Bacillus velezensis]|uniref:hypothetical protein n=2 Tax=Bacillaceae TaxID=186817 RepID=UPI0029DD8BD4|nr:hypothetical protein [Bacillus velezensis]MDX7897492.1 hypothetical protein [Bacillus velezensis]MDX8028522.1 hypothetical protein [Bacillus velezensis]MDX8201769.1 hypothetical protein [Bacillus velezensis]MDX8227485.1 hypothetical protein [Bacillus velezensis]